MKTIHLISNAHIDPVWLWEWEEGAAETISTFRVAAEFCEQYDGYVFNHNEVILYKWVEEYEPALFERIQALVKQGRWHIMGGWFLQPDCNMPSGESFVRQVLTGRTYFKNKFGAVPTTAINFDPFGHTRGLVQILKKSGYDSYLFCRPMQHDLTLPAEDFTWVGYDGSEVIGTRANDFYTSPRGEAANKVRKWIGRNGDKAEGIVLWGVGNHGGGPSRVDMERLRELMEETKSFNIVHSTPEAYFQELRTNGSPVPRFEGELNPWAPGCYTSQIRIKQKHRRLENELFMVEKMLSHASLQGLLYYPKEELEQALYDLMFAEFHDILPGTSIQPVEEASLRLMDHGLEIMSRLKVRAFFALSRGQQKAPDGEIPILVYNPHPYKVSGIFECEFQLADQNWDGQFTVSEVHDEAGNRLPCQNEKELSNMRVDWRKRIAFRAELEPSTMSRFNCKLVALPSKPKPQLKEVKGAVTFVTEDMTVVINGATGFIDQYEVNGIPYLGKNAFRPLVLEDNDDSWEMFKKRFDDVLGEFKLMSRERSTAFSGVRLNLLRSVRVIEDGPVRSVVEAVFEYGDSFICLTYKLPKAGTELQVDVRVHWNEKSKMLKLSIPTVFEKAVYQGQVAYGVNTLPSDGNESVSHKWSAIAARDGSGAVTIIDDGIYGSDFCDGELRLSLLRSAGYSGHPTHENIPIMEQDRYSPRIDQGERLYRFWLNAGPTANRMSRVGREAQAHNEKPFALSFFPRGEGEKPLPVVRLGDDVVELSAMKLAENGEHYILRLFEPTGTARRTVIELPALGMSKEIELRSFEIRTFRLDARAKTLLETDLMENVLEQSESS